MTLSSMRNAVLTVFSSNTLSSFPLLMCRGRLMLPRLHTAVSSNDVLSVISVHKLLECTTPQWSCGDRMLQGSFQVIQGCPVSKSMVSIFLQRSRAFMVFVRNIFPSC